MEHVFPFDQCINQPKLSMNTTSRKEIGCHSPEVSSDVVREERFDETGVEFELTQIPFKDVLEDLVWVGVSRFE